MRASPPEARRRQGCRRGPSPRRGFAASSSSSSSSSSTGGGDRDARQRQRLGLGVGSAPPSPSSAPPRVDADTLVLGIETSCDDTGAAVVTGDGRVLGEALASQVEIHERWGGVVPNLARDAHERAIDAVVAEALRRAGIDDPSRLSAVAVTVGPGLTMCLRVGVVAAQELSAKHALPIVPVHHMEAHALVARLAAGTTRCRFPFLALLVSGGHNQARSILSTLVPIRPRSRGETPFLKDFCSRRISPPRVPRFQSPTHLGDAIQLHP